jgi:hypothetical protein
MDRIHGGSRRSKMKPNQPLEPMGSTGSPQVMQADATARITPSVLVAYL